MSKSILNSSSTDPNKLMPMKYPWAYKHYEDGVANNWTPQEINMTTDIEQWTSKDALTADEKLLVTRNLGFFSTAEALTANNIVIAMYKHVTNPECRLYMLRQAFEEAIHSTTFVYCVESLGLDAQAIYDSYEDIPSIKEKDEFAISLTKYVDDPNFTTDTTEGIQGLLHDAVGFYVIMEGIFFYAGFVSMLSLLRQQKMVGVGEQFQYILRDESVHLAFGRDLINTIVEENPDVWTEEFKTEIVENIKKAVELEDVYIDDCLPRGILGLNANSIKEYVRYIADRRLESINLPIQYKADNPFPWMSEIIDMKKQKNFFETKVTEYQSGGNLDW